MKKIVVGIIIVIVVSLLFAFPTMLLWNQLMPEIFGLQEIGFWQSLGLVLLARFIFGEPSNSSKND